MNTKLRVYAKDLAFKIPFGEFLFSKVSFVLHQGAKVGLIGANGSGKSTILKMLDKKVIPFSGKVETYGSIVYLPQVNFELVKDKQLFEFLSEFTDDWWEVLAYAQKEFGVSETISPNQVIGTLSGGELMKIYLSRFLMKKPDIMLLDEPTNHIDIASLEVLISVLRSYEGTVICASHDTFFLNQFVNKIIAIEYKTSLNYGGNYDHYVSVKMALDNGFAKDLFALRQKVRRLDRALTIEDRRRRKSIEFGKSLAGDRSMSRIEKGYFKEKAAKSTAKITKSLLAKKDRAVLRVEAMDRPEPRRVDFLFSTGISDIDTLIDIKGTGKLQVEGKILLQNIMLQIKKGQRIAILGANGSGKTLFLKSLLGLQPETITATGIETMGTFIAEYIGQDFSRVVELDQSVKKMTDILDDSTNTYKSLIGQLGLDRSDVYRAADTFSGGELTKLLLLDIAHTPIDLLILDEPTNHLDILSQNSLINGLLGFDGALVITSHKLDFITNVGLDQIYCISKKELVKVDCDPSNPEEVYAKVLPLIRD